LVAGVAPGEADELVPLLGDIEPEDGVDDELDEPDDGGVLDDVLPGVEDEPDVEPVPEDVELDDVEPDDDGGVVVDDEDEDGDGVTVGGVVEEVFVSRWQPATPTASPAHHVGELAGTTARADRMRRRGERPRSGAVAARLRLRLLLLGDGHRSRYLS